MYEHYYKSLDIELLNKTLRAYSVLLGEIEFVNAAPDYCYYPKNRSMFEVMIKEYRYEIQLSKFLER